MPKVTQLDSGIAGIGTQIYLTLKSMLALSTTVCFEQNKIITVGEVRTAMGKQEGVLYSSKESTGIMLQGLHCREMVVQLLLPLKCWASVQGLCPVTGKGSGLYCSWHYFSSYLFNKCDKFLSMHISRVNNDRM